MNRTCFPRRVKGTLRVETCLRRVPSGMFKAAAACEIVSSGPAANTSTGLAQSQGAGVASSDARRAVAAARLRVGSLVVMTSRCAASDGWARPGRSCASFRRSRFATGRHVPKNPSSPTHASRSPECFTRCDNPNGPPEPVRALATGAPGPPRAMGARVHPSGPPNARPPSNPSTTLEPRASDRMRTSPAHWDGRRPTPTRPCRVTSFRRPAAPQRPSVRAPMVRHRRAPIGSPRSQTDPLRAAMKRSERQNSARFGGVAGQRWDGNEFKSPSGHHDRGPWPAETQTRGLRRPRARTSPPARTWCQRPGGRTTSSPEVRIVTDSSAGRPGTTTTLVDGAVSSVQGRSSVPARRPRRKLSARSSASHV